VLAIDRVLKVNLEECVGLLEATKWKFYEARDDHIRVEVPRDNENLVVELRYRDDAEKARIVARLAEEGFNEQEVRPWRA